MFRLGAFGLGPAQKTSQGRFTRFCIDLRPPRRYAVAPKGRDVSMVASILSFARREPPAAAAIAIAVIGIAAIGGAYFFQYVVGLPPCPLCLEQRVAYYVAIPLAAMILLGLSVNSSRKVVALALFAIACAMLWNAGLGVYHSGVEWQWWPGPQDCSGAVPNFSAGGSLLDQMNKTRVVRCDEAAWRFLGLSLAGYNVLISLALAVIALFGARAAWRSRNETSQETSRA
jgi:disulfide bond formation protein DsbB